MEPVGAMKAGLGKTAVKPPANILVIVVTMETVTKDNVTASPVFLGGTAQLLSV